MYIDVSHSLNTYGNVIYFSDNVVVNSKDKILQNVYSETNVIITEILTWFRNNFVEKNTILKKTKQHTVLVLKIIITIIIIVIISTLEIIQYCS